MYEFDWANKTLWAAEARVDPVTSRLPRDRVANTLLVHWEEHCVECAPPQCYSTCPLYVRRGDHRCARFFYGLFPHRDFQGLFDHGADVRFRRWGKLETRLLGRTTSVREHRRLDRIDAAATGLVAAASKALVPLTKRQRLTAKWAQLRESSLTRTGKPGGRYDEFVLECFVPEKQGFRLILERIEGGVPNVRKALDLEPGHNFHVLPAALFGRLDQGRLRIYPEDDGEHRVIFLWLDFVAYASRPQPADKVKVLCWDLDNTLWRGSLLDDGEEACVLREGARELIQQLDARGILQTVVSKNDHEHAWRHVERMELQDFFLYPAITWGQKSESIRQIAAEFNLGLDTFALIDDAAFEREEVRSALPMVRVYDEAAIDSILGFPEFDVPITEMSAQRRLSYRAQVDRDRIRATFRDDYRSFIRSCELGIRIFVPLTESELRRCRELVQRSNQLNLSGRRHSEDEFAQLVGRPQTLCVAFDATDRFGRYGIVAFVSVDESGEQPVIRDFVMSCRIAGKLVEQAFFRWLGEHEQRRGATTLRAELRRTDRNAPLVNVLSDIGFTEASRATPNDRDVELLELALGGLAADDLVAVSAEV